MEMEKIGIIVTTYNRPEELRTCLGAVIQQAKARTPEVIVIVIDDGSKLDNVSVSDRADYYYWQENDGYRLSTARNIGARIAIGEGATILVFLDGDLIVQPGWLDAMIDGAREGLTFGEINGQVSDVTRLKDRPWLAATGGNMAVTTELWNEVGEFDTRYDGNWGVEDTDWAFRALNINAKLVQQDANAFHREHKSSQDWRKEQIVNWNKFEEKFPGMVGVRPTPSRTAGVISQEAIELTPVISIPDSITEGVWLITATKGRPSAISEWPKERMTWGLPMSVVEDGGISAMDLMGIMDKTYLFFPAVGIDNTSESTRIAINAAKLCGAKYIIELDDHDTLRRGPEDVVAICNALKNGVDYVYGNYILSYKRRRHNPCPTLNYEQGMLSTSGMPWMGVKAYSIAAYDKAGGYIAEDFPGGDYSLALRMELAGCSFKKIDDLWTICPMEVDSLTAARKGETHDKIREYQARYTGCEKS